MATKTMDKYIFSPYDSYPRGFDKKSDAAKMEAIGEILKMSPEAFYVVKDIIRWAYQYTDQAEPEAMTEDEPDRYALAYYASRAKIECVQEVLRWKRAVDDNYRSGRVKLKPKASAPKAKEAAAK